MPKLKAPSSLIFTPPFHYTYSQRRPARLRHAITLQPNVLLILHCRPSEIEIRVQAQDFE